MHTYRLISSLRHVRLPLMAMPIALFIIVLIHLPIAQADSVLKSQPSGIVDDNRQVVGSGPPLNIVAPSPSSGEAAIVGAYEKALLALGSFKQQLEILERDTTMVTEMLAKNAVAIGRLREFLASTQRTRDLAARTGSKFLADYDRQLREDLDDLRAIEMEQESLIAGTKKRWEELNANLQQQIQELSGFPEFQKVLQNEQKNFAPKRQLSELRLHLSAGQSKEFRQLADATQGNDALRKDVLLMRVADYMEQGEGRNALYAARLGMQLYPDAPAFSKLSQSQDVSYLKMLANKAGEDRAAIHQAWTEYSGEVSDSWVKQFFFGGLRHTTDIASGKAYELELVQKDAMLRGVMEQNGIEVVSRLRQKGLSFDEIKALSPDELQTKLGLKNPLSGENVQMFHTAVQSAFHNADVKRLLSQNKEQFDIDMNRSYYELREFQRTGALAMTPQEVDEGFLEFAADGISVKNMILFFGPGAVVGQGARGAMAKFATKLGMEEKAAIAALQVGTETVTAQQLLTRPLMNTTAKFLQSSAAGSKAMNVLQKGADLRYYKAAAGWKAGESLLTIGTKVAGGTALGLGELYGQFKAFELGGELGHFVGGDVGKFIVEAGIAFAGNPLEAVHGWQTREAAAFEATAKQMAEQRVKWNDTNQKLEKVRLTVRDGVSKAIAGETPSQQAIRELEEAIAQAEQISASSPSVAGSANGPVVQAIADEAEALAAAGKALKNGNAQSAQMADDIARQQEAGAKAAAAELEKGEQALEQAAQRAKNQSVNPGDNAPPAPVGQGPLEESTLASSEKLSARFQPGEKTLPPPDVPSLPEPKLPTGGTPQECDRMGREALKNKQFKDAAHHFRTGHELEQQAKKTIEGYSPEYSPDFWQKKINDAEHAARYSERNAQRALRNQELAREADEALRPFTPEHRESLKKIQHQDTIELASEPGAQRTAGNPRRVVEKLADGTERAVGIWKPAGGGGRATMGRDGQMMAEVLFSKLANKLGLRVPHAEKWTLVDAAGVAHEGVLIRYIHHSHDLQKLSAGSILALKDQIAKFRPLQVLMGNFDVHFGNFRIDRAGRVWAIDAGIAEMGTLDWDLQDLIAHFERFGGKRTSVAGLNGNDVLDKTRVFRDAYRTYPIEKTREAIRTLDEIMGADMAGAARDAKRLTPQEFNKLVDEVMPGHDYSENIKETYKVRHDNLEELLEERWPGATSAPGTTSPPTGNLQGKLLQFPPRFGWLEPVALQRAA